VQIAIGLLELSPPEQRLENVRRHVGRFNIELSRFGDPALALQIPREIGQQNRVAPASDLQDAPIVELTDVRVLRLGEYHAHEIMGSRVHGRQPHGVACMSLGSREIAGLKKQHSSFERGVDIVGVNCDKALQQCCCCLSPVLTMTNLGQNPQRSRCPRSHIQYIAA
jgi:hypothetical protein